MMSIDQPAEVPPNSYHPATRAEWRDWLALHHAQPEGIWLITYRKAAGRPTLSYEDSVEEALCFGWVDSRPRKLDEQRTMLWFAPRKPKSGWSQPNKIRVERLIASGLMAPAGLAKIEAAKEDGSWNLLDEVERLQMPADLSAALDSLPDARPHFEAFPRSVKRGILEWIASAKRPETRAGRIAETARLAAQNERANQWRKLT
jgi:uncharacterized protein YdeI (YjbR/CyaY-like superfamily)